MKKSFPKYKKKKLIGLLGIVLSILVVVSSVIWLRSIDIFETDTLYENFVYSQSGETFYIEGQEVWFQEKGKIAFQLYKVENSEETLIGKSGGLHSYDLSSESFTVSFYAPNDNTKKRIYNYKPATNQLFYNFEPIN